MKSRLCTLVRVLSLATIALSGNGDDSGDDVTSGHSWVNAQYVSVSSGQFGVDCLITEKWGNILVFFTRGDIHLSPVWQSI